MSTDFKWTDELIAEFFTKWITTDLRLPEQMEQFKASKQPKLEWEIMAYRFKPTETVIHNSSKSFQATVGDNSDYEIYSVKRLSDNEVFSIGDFINFQGEGLDGFLPIQKFDIDYFDKSKICAWHSYKGIGPQWWEKHKKQVLFTTEDGEPVYKDQSFYYVDKQFGIHIYSADSAWTPKVDGLEFSTREKAEEYVSENKKSISLADLREVIGSRDFVGSTFIINHIKDKLNLK